VRRYQELAFRVALLNGCGVQDAEDVTQEAFVKAYYALKRFREGAPLRPWLLRIVANEARNRRKASTRRYQLALRAAEGNVENESTPDALAALKEQKESVVSALNQLREEDRAIIAYRYFFELSEAEIATTMACPRGTVKSRLSRALDRLRAVMVSDTATVGSRVDG
jgi:RNA polymerase sigma-70 factor (ECF subfamily)